MIKKLKKAVLPRQDPPNGLDIDIRFLLANERTLLAWVRTSVALIGGGVAFGLLSSAAGDANYVGLGAIVIGGVFSVVGYRRYLEADAAIREGKLPPTGSAGLLVVVAVIVFAAAIVGAAAIVS